MKMEKRENQYMTKRPPSKFEPVAGLTIRQWVKVGPATALFWRRLPQSRTRLHRVNYLPDVHPKLKDLIIKCTLV